ncbi:sensor domain-containing diguanylate cyclase [Sulfuriferula nivalis]|uniref:Diguanylate cyclase/phosphodiesterase n=1 Tax=Sulfuriferula nivalis TaxID=2675298 RepID=A0A809SA83_9PROT|nr:GGDEF domain-containing protein [Sulfuriferula nivalis]BBP01422.1 hypothetical protein SFSGTM_21300 [Sulfuriferula nivalis]
MKIHKLTLVGIVTLGLALIILSIGFYTIARIEMISKITDGLEQSLFDLESNTRRALQNDRGEDVQAILDQVSVLNKAVAEASFSRNGRTIEASSSRSLNGSAISRAYLPLSQMKIGLTSRNHLFYRDDFYYFEGAQKYNATLLIQVNEEYVFGHLQKIASYYWLAVFLTLVLLGTIMFLVIRRVLVIPLEMLTQHAQSADSKKEAYFIDELAELDCTLSDSFTHMRNQQHNLQIALDESHYLDEILRTVADINQLLITASGVEELIGKSVQRLSQHPGYAACWLATSNPNDRIEIKALSSSLSSKLIVGMVLDDGTDSLNSPVIQAFGQRKTIVVDQLQSHAANTPWYLFAENDTHGSFIALPLLPSVHDKPIGVLGLYSLPTIGFAAKEIAMLEELAGDVGFAIRAFMQRDQLENHLTTDPTTQLPNRVALADRLVADPNVMLSIINIDRFSDINEVYGVVIGDGVLAEYGRWLSHLLDSRDDISLFKIGSDEYVLVFSECINLMQCKEFLDHLIMLSAKASFVIDDVEIVLTVTVGMAAASDQVLEHATSALKQAKLARQSIQMYDSTLSKRGQESNIAWYKRLREAIEESRIVPYFQPIVNNQTRRIVKYEALMRLIERDGNVVSPYEFLGIAKKTKLYGQLTKMMVDKVIAVFKDSDIPVSINLSTEDLLNGELADYLERTILLNQIGKIIIFEILESEGIENYVEVSAFVERFKSIGCRFAIDDFGSGYSNFDHLLKLNIDTLKIDGSLIKNLPHDRNAQIIVKHICDFAGEMGISTVAEFVSNEEITGRSVKLALMHHKVIISMSQHSCWSGNDWIENAEDGDGHLQMQQGPSWICQPLRLI